MSENDVHYPVRPPRTRDSQYAHDYYPQPDDYVQHQGQAVPHLLPVHQGQSQESEVHPPTTTEREPARNTAFSGCGAALVNKASPTFCKVLEFACMIFVLFIAIIIFLAILGVFKSPPSFAPMKFRRSVGGNESYPIPQSKFRRSVGDNESYPIAQSKFRRPPRHKVTFVQNADGSRTFVTDLGKKFVLTAARIDELSSMVPVCYTPYVDDNEADAYQGRPNCTRAANIAFAVEMEGLLKEMACGLGLSHDC